MSTDIKFGPGPLDTGMIFAMVQHGVTESRFELNDDGLGLSGEEIAEENKVLDEIFRAMLKPEYAAKWEGFK